MGGPGSMFNRNKEDAIEAQTQLWRAMCDGKPKSLRKYITDDAVLAQADNQLYSSNTEPTLSDYLDNDFEPWTAYKIHDDPEFVEIDMMSSSLVYRVTAWRQDAKGRMIPTEAICCSVWRQTAGGDWRCCVHQMTKV